MERIHVSVRARPLSPEDAKTSPWRIAENSIFMPNQPSRFEFDRIFGEDSKTADVYRARTRDIVAAAVRGFNGTVFAYGQTSSGKTHTMRGSNSEPGVIPLAVHDLFDIIQQEIDREFLLRMSYMEIYNEEINDLLAPEHRKLQVHESIERGIFVAGLRENIVASSDQVLEFMEFGESHRHIGETNMNLYSSRSHTIFRMIIESREKTDNAEVIMSCDAVRVSVLNLVDLAGSERAAKTGAEGVRLKEGSHINKSLMTLGTVIKKLSEGVESQGGHVPYRDSKLTRILQPALGGNANTAIICNITLAQIHADETKSSLQFASRALRVTNCAHVNEILTDAALLKRQKKEIEDLRAKLQGVHSEHQEEDILSLRNTLLKSELERERMALELEEEKRAQLEREKRLQEQAKRIENLSSMVFCANSEETSDILKKAKRRDTWCPGNLVREKLELSSEVKEKAPEVKSKRTDHVTGPLLPFDELVGETTKEDVHCKKSTVDDCSLPDPCALLHVTSRRKYPPRKSSPMESNGLADIHEEYEKLLIEFETHRTVSQIQIDHLTKKLAEAEDEKCRNCTTQNTTATFNPDESVSLSESDAILIIKQLQEKIAKLEMEKSASQQNLDCVYNLATEQTLSAQEKYEKLHEELMLAREEATLAHKTLASEQSKMEKADWLNSLITEAQEIKLEFDNSRQLIKSTSSSMVEDFHDFFSVMSNQLVDLRPSIFQSALQMKSIIKSHENLQSSLMNKVHKLEDEKLVICNEASKVRSKIEELSLNAQNSANAFMELNEEHELEKSEFISQIQMLQRENLSLASSSLVKEKESIRKDLEKTKIKLKDTESKLKNAVQEKIKLEGEKSCSEREVKRLQGQQAMLERNMNKQESIIDRKQAKGATAEAAMQDEYKKLEMLAIEMEATIASLEDQLAIANEEKDVATSQAETLASDFQTLSDELQMAHEELTTLNEEVSVLRTSLEESRVYVENLKNSLMNLSQEKEELSMQFSEALMTIEEEKAIWSSKENASVKLIEEKEKQHNVEISLLSEELSKAINELEICKKKCKDLDELLTRSEENVNSEKMLNTKLDSTCRNVVQQIETLQLELTALRKEREYLSGQVQKLETEISVSTDDSQVVQLKLEMKEQSKRLANVELKKHKGEVENSKEMAKHRMRLRGTQAKLDCFRFRYLELVDELALADRKFKEASKNLKQKLTSQDIEILHLKEENASLKRK